MNRDLQQQVPSVVRRSAQRFEQIDQLIGGEMRGLQKQLNATYGRYYSRVSANRQEDGGDDFSGVLLDMAKRSGVSFLKEFSARQFGNVTQNQNISTSRRGGSSQKQVYAQFAQLLRLGLSQNG